MLFDDEDPEPIDIVSRSQFKDLCQSLETVDAESLPRAYRIYTIGDGDLATTLSESAILHRVLSSVNSIPTIEGISRFHFTLGTIEVNPARVGDLTELIEGLDEDEGRAQEQISRYGDRMWANGCIDERFPVKVPEGQMWVSIELVGTEWLMNRLFSTSITDALVTLSNMKQVCFGGVEFFQSGGVSTTQDSHSRSKCTSLAFRDSMIQGDAAIMLPHEILANLESIDVQISEHPDNQWTKKDEFFSEVMKLTSLKKIVVRDYDNSHSLMSLAKAIATQPNIPEINVLETDVFHSFSTRDMDMLLNAVVAKQLSLKELILSIPDLDEKFALPKGLCTRTFYLRMNRQQPFLIQRHFFEMNMIPTIILIEGALLSQEAAKLLSHAPLQVLSLDTRFRTRFQDASIPLDADVLGALFHSESALNKSLWFLNLHYTDIPEPAMACLAASVARLSSLKYLDISPSGRETQIPQLIHILKQSKTITGLKSYEDNMGQRYPAILDVIVNRRKPRPPNFPGIENATPEQKQLAKSYSLQLNHFLLLNKSGVHKCLQRLESSDGISPIFLPGILNWIDQGHPREALYFLLRQRPASFASAYQKASHQS